MLKQRVITATILAVFFLAAVFWFPSWMWAVLVTLMVMQGAFEWSRLAGMQGFAVFAYLATTLILFLLILLMVAVVHSHLSTPIKIAIYGFSAVFWIVLVPLWFKNSWNIKNTWLLVLIGWILLLPMGMAMLDLRAANPQPWWLLGVMAMVWVADISAYFVGRQFGKNKLAPTISPGKTWEGVAGALVGVLIYVAWVMNANDMSQRYSLLVFAAAGVALSILGDLFESAIKRLAGVKDSGDLLPGHGGLLDRIDALTSTLPLAALVLILMNPA